MGVLSNLVVAPEGDAQKVARTDVPSQTLGGIDIKGIDTIKFCQLHAMLTGKSYDDLISGYDAVAEESEDGPWVFRVPPELVSRLAGLQAHELPQIAKKWAAIEEFTADGWTEADVSNALTSIANLSKKALSPGQALFLWMCL